ncbi:MAG TPA: hypothetical protein PLF36_09830, partial [Syntrophales bacterium]|nr:hypothetical protein [Syntrophales bacterium]
MKRLQVMLVALLLLLGGLGYSLFAAQAQRVTLVPDNANPKVGDTVTITARYNVDGGGASTGTTFAVYFDATKLEFLGYGTKYNTGFNTASTKAYNKSGNPDGDPTTNKYVQMSWIDSANPPTWPGTSSSFPPLPVDLIQIKFKVLTVASEVSSNVNIVDVEHDFNYDFIGTGTKINIKLPPGSISGTIGGVYKSGPIYVGAYS